MNSRRKYQLRMLIEPHLETLVKELLTIAIGKNAHTGEYLHNVRHRMRAMNLLMDRCVGKPSQSMVLTGDEDGGPVRLEDSRLLLAAVLAKLVPSDAEADDGGRAKRAANGSGGDPVVRLVPPGEREPAPS